MNYDVITARRVLLIDDDPQFIDAARSFIGDLGQLRVVSTAEEALKTAVRWRPQLIILDVLLSHVDAFKLLEEIRANLEPESCGIVFLTKGRGAITHFQVHDREFFGIMERSIDEFEFRTSVSQALEMSAATM